MRGNARRSDGGRDSLQMRLHITTAGDVTPSAFYFSTSTRAGARRENHFSGSRSASANNSIVRIHKIPEQGFVTCLCPNPARYTK